MQELKKSNRPERTKPTNMIVSMAMIPVLTNKMTMSQKGTQIIVPYINPANGIEKYPPSSQ